MIGAIKFLAARRVQLAGWLLAAIFGWLIGTFYDGRTGFTRLLAIGDQLEASTVTRLRQVPHYVYDGTIGYDGAYYVQLALHPTLQEPELRGAIDDLPYRARRMLMYWTAWLLGVGRADSVVNAYALLNAGAWFALAWLLLRWFPLNTWDNLLRWGGLLFSHGVCMSVRNSLADLPGLLLVTMALAALERGRRGRGLAALAAATLTKETSLLAAAALLEPARSPDRVPMGGARRWRRFAGVVVLVIVPLALWIGYVRWRVGPVGESGLNNFTWPAAGLAQKWGTAAADWFTYGSHPPYVASLLTVAALTVQGWFLLTRWRPAEAWWRVGASFAVLMLFLSEPVWEGYPGAATRVLLPMALAFNVLVPRGRRWLPVLLLGNLTVLVAPQELRAPPEFFHVSGPHALVTKLAVERSGGWYAAETVNNVRWRWSSGEAALKLTNGTAQPVAVELRGAATSAGDERQLRVSRGDTTLWTGPITPKMTPVQFGLVAPPGETVITFKSEQPALMVDTDPRQFSFKIVNLEIVVRNRPDSN